MNAPAMSAAMLPALPKPRSGRELDLLEKANSTPSTGAPTGQTNERRSLRIAIVTENFLPKIDGVTRTLAMLLEHLQAEGHEALVLGPASTLVRRALLDLWTRFLLTSSPPDFVRRSGGRLDEGDPSPWCLPGTGTQLFASALHSQAP
jgi:hypothetical protein